MPMIPAETIRQIDAEHEARLNAVLARLTEAERDAARYRFIRSSYAKSQIVPSVRQGLDDADQFDAAVDAAMSAP